MRGQVAVPNSDHLQLGNELADKVHAALVGASPRERGEASHFGPKQTSLDVRGAEADLALAARGGNGALLSFGLVSAALVYLPPRQYPDSEVRIIVRHARLRTSESQDTRTY